MTDKFVFVKLAYPAPLPVSFSLALIVPYPSSSGHDDHDDGVF